MSFEALPVTEEMSKTLSAEQQKIRELEAKLKAAEQRADKEADRADKAEKRAELAEARLMEKTELSDHAWAITASAIAELSRHTELAIEQDAELLEKIILDGLSSLKNIENEDALIARYASKIRKGADTKKLTATQKPEEQKLREGIEKKARSISVRTAERKKVSEALKALPPEVKPEDSEISNAVNLIQDEERRSAADEKTKKAQESHGRQAVEALRNAPLQNVPAPEAKNLPVCSCGRQFFLTKTLTMEVTVRGLSETLEHMVRNMRHAYPIAECVCGNKHLVIEGQEIPVAFSRSMSQDLVLTAAGLVVGGKLPLDRVTKLFFGEDDKVGSSTLEDNSAAWLESAGGKYLVQAIVERAKQADCVIADETPLRILQQEGNSKKTAMLDANGNEVLVDSEDQEGIDAVIANGGKSLAKKAYIEVLTSRPGADEPFSVYRRLDSRSAESISKALAGFKAEAWVTDAYGGYDTIFDALPAHNHQCCLVHLLREIGVAVPCKDINELAQSASGLKVLGQKYREMTPDLALHFAASAIQAVLRVEKTLKREDGEDFSAWMDRIRKGREKSRPFMDALDVFMNKAAEDLVEKQKKRWVRKSASPLVKPIVFYLNHRENFRQFLDNPLLVPESNQVERSVRPIAVLRSACNFKQSRAHTDVLCDYFTLFETAKLAGINKPVQWLVEFGRAFFQHCADIGLRKRAEEGADLTRFFEFTKDAMESFDVTPWLPWNYAKNHPGL